jgi:hypothetical protein
MVNMKAKILVLGMAATAALGFAAAVTAAPFTITAKPVVVNPNSTSVHWLDGFDLEGVTSLGNCQLDGGRGFVEVSMNRPGTIGNIDPSGDRIFALVTAAELTGKPITLHVDDAILDANGICMVEWAYM